MGLFSMFHDDPQLSRSFGLALAGRHKIYKWLVDTLVAETGATRSAAFSAIDAAIPPKGEAMLSDLAGVADIYETARSAFLSPVASRAVMPGALH